MAPNTLKEIHIEITTQPSIAYEFNMMTTGEDSDGYI